MEHHLSQEARPISWVACTFLLAVWLWPGCGGGTAGTEGGLDVTIAYNGVVARTGQPLAVAIYESYPPKGPPLTYRVIEDYSLPYTVHFEGLPQGEYVLGASIDLDPSDTPHVGMLKAGVDPFAYAGHPSRIQVSQDTPPPSVGLSLQRPR